MDGVVGVECRAPKAGALGPRRGASPMAKTFKRGDHVEWNSEAGIVRGVIFKKVVSDVRIKGYVHHASKKEPQYFIKSDKTDHVAIHKGKALKLLKAQA
jgi:Hypervirulence associated proteins TUDOR domain